MFINYLNDVVAKRAYSRKLEEEADAVGLELMATAGYDPRAALDLWELMACVEEDVARAGRGLQSMEHKLGFLRTHPTSETRMKALEKDMEGALKTWKMHLPARKLQVRKEMEERKKAEEVVLATKVEVREAGEKVGSPVAQELGERDDVVRETKSQEEVSKVVNEH